MFTDLAGFWTSSMIVLSCWRALLNGISLVVLTFAMKRIVHEICAFHRAGGLDQSFGSSRFWTNSKPNRPLMQRWPCVTLTSSGDVTFTMRLSWVWRVNVQPTPQYAQMVSVFFWFDSSQVPAWRMSYSVLNISAPVGQTPMQFPQ